MGDGSPFEPPLTQYAKAGDLHIAYQVVGDGPIDVLFVPELVSNVEMAWEEPLQTSFLQGLASFSRLILFDKRGTGLSDPVPVDRPPTLEDRMADIDAVLERWVPSGRRCSVFLRVAQQVLCSVRLIRIGPHRWCSGALHLGLHGLRIGLGASHGSRESPT